ncbi:MAG: prephenate dehydrogenase/arogenate dehydrogenase family protein [Hamadaea sp.]|uniref:prephenate dehydrogenase n=1 Tax=Hamadaea sp. TaxID=2024425 RepID=UPI0017A65601|nr:prephenate dehydrogenase/arogenate dehydrogenase family protein [Hamadaea sp.]NUR71491.1 prephenate dehydrogenase/arogenate dehydrogenase family protein [Hamadaea sp.]NUT22154.1 prephenate dehydrogenase/arogenate dehydrogenase family protein [Hamadaea sp.]
MARDGLRIAVVGTGLIGGSILRRLAQTGHEVVGWDPDPASRETAAALGLPFADQLAPALADRDVVFLCGPLSSLPTGLAEVVAATGDQCVVTDVGSTKIAVAAYAERAGLAHRFVGGHPMAGSERAGLTAATPDLYVGAPWVLTPLGVPGLPAFRLLTRLVLESFDARVVPLDATVHDDVVALASHIPHILAGTLATATERADVRAAVLSLAAGSFSDGTRVAGTPAARTADMLLNNREAISRRIELVREAFDEIVDAVVSGDAERLRAYLGEGRRARLDLLARDTEPSSVSFGDDDDELAYLLELGASGGCITACDIAADRVTYSVLRPATP